MKQRSVMLRATLIAGLAVSIAGCSGMLSGDPFEEEVASDAKSESLSYSLSRKLLSGLGATSSSTDKKIEYKPRAPLAMPPATTLPQPEDQADVAAASPNWPAQNDEADDYIASLEEAKTYREKNRDDWEDPVVPGREMARYRVIGGGNVASVKDNDQSDEAPEMTAAEAKQFSEEMNTLRTAEADGVPKRKYLIDPPSTYRTPAGNATLPSKVKVEDEEGEGKHDDWENPGGF